MEKNSKFNELRAFNKAVGPGKKNPKLINVGTTFIPDYRVIAFLRAFFSHVCMYHMYDCQKGKLLTYDCQ